VHPARNVKNLINVKQWLVAGVVVSALASPAIAGVGLDADVSAVATVPKGVAVVHINVRAKNTGAGTWLARKYSIKTVTCKGLSSSSWPDTTETKDETKPRETAEFELEIKLTKPGTYECEFQMIDDMNKAFGKKGKTKPFTYGVTAKK
jgi:hypothetical protein